MSKRRARTIPRSQWQWSGHAGHFICGRWCRFHLTTLVGRFIVSTLGEYVHPRHSGGSEQAELKWLDQNWPGEDVGSGRKYETMVFLAGEACDSDRCGCGFPQQLNGRDLDYAGANTAGEASKNHYELCKEWAARQDYERPDGQ